MVTGDVLGDVDPVMALSADDCAAIFAEAEDLVVMTRCSIVGIVAARETDHVESGAGHETWVYVGMYSEEGVPVGVRVSLDNVSRWLA